MTLFRIDLDLEQNYKDLITEVLKVLTVFSVVYLMNTYSSSKSIFDADPTDFLVYYGLGVLFYYLVVKQIIEFV